jgi:serine/threonine protein kinase/tetratricopeptide (TPR) repeat protein
MIGQLLSHYTLTEKIGEGGMGVVYRARDEQLCRDVAIKVLPAHALDDEIARKRFRKEALSLARLNHPNIETVHEFGSQQGVDFLVTEYIEGTTLNSMLLSGPLPEDEVLRLGAQLAEGLEAAHHAGVVHRDLKPANLRVTASGRLKILDFGLAVLMPGNADSTVTVSLIDQPTAGTLQYMSPEQLRGEMVDGRTDIWAAGTVLYEMVTGRKPFDNKTPTAVALAIISERPTPPRSINPSISPRLEAIISKCLEKLPGNRYQSVHELSDDLLDVHNSGGVVTTHPTSKGRSRFGPLPLAAAIGILLVLAFLFNVGELRDRFNKHSGEARIGSIAVLPLANLSADPSQEYFSDGMTDELIANLGKIGSVRVISRTSISQYKGTRETLPQIAKELRVDAIVEGSVFRDGDHVRITARLMQGAADRQLWGESYDGDLHDVLQLQNRVARAIAGEIRLTLTPGEQSRLTGSRRIDPQAYESYLKGRFYWNQRTPDSLQQALQYFQRALNVDPTYAAAYAGMADTYNLMGNFDLLPAKVCLEKAMAAAHTALELDDNLAEAHAALGGALQGGSEWNFNGAEKEFNRALELNPNYATARLWHGLNLLALGRSKDAVPEFRKAEELDPLSPIASTYVGFSLQKVRRYDEAITANRQTLALFPEFSFAHWTLAMAYRQKGQYDSAIAEFRKAIELSQGRPDFIATLGHAYAVSGNKEQALRIAQELEAKRAPAFALAIIYLGLGDRDRTFRLMQQAYDERYQVMPEALHDPLFDPIRSDPRFQDLLRRIGVPQ